MSLKTIIAWTWLNGGRHYDNKTAWPGLWPYKMVTSPHGLYNIVIEDNDDVDISSAKANILHIVIVLFTC